jgi:butyryl-CoA dehydrogenase
MGFFREKRTGKRKIRNTLKNLMAHSRRNLDFILFEVLNVSDLSQYDYFEAHDRESFSFVLDSATEIARSILEPAFQEADRHPPVIENGKVKVHPGIHDFIRAFSETGLIAATFSFPYGGIQLPKTVFAAVDHILGSANNSLIMYTDLAKGVCQMIDTFGTADQKEQYIPRILGGEWMGTMCLTEPQAGSSLSDINTTAIRQPDGSFKILGHKIFISAGDHDASSNIIHLVLARIQGAPPGTKGISLFIVPKMIDINGALSSNDVTSVAMYHKMGQKATPAMHLEFGTNQACTGYLLGEENRGLPQMFQMMNAARLDVGLGGINIASAAYHKSLQYAHERPQGRRIGHKNVLEDPVEIIQHADVRRMLFLQKAIVEGCLTFLFYCYQLLDLEKTSGSESEKESYISLLELLTPTAKSYGSEMGIISVNNGLQVLGGYGYTEDFPLEQMARDVRIMSIYEGTTGIQALALLARQVMGNEGRSLQIWRDKVNEDLVQVATSPELSDYGKKLEGYLETFFEITEKLLVRARQAGIELATIDANLYQEAFGILNISWQWLRQALVAEQKLSTESSGSEDRIFYKSKLETMKFFFHYEVPKLAGIFMRLQEQDELTLFNEKEELII